jgi:carbonic anhydrase/acetyltransferase-like protein (isoleucine patch superfamily)
MAIYRLGGHSPHVPQSAYVAPEAVVIGKVTLGEYACVLPGAVIRGDNDTIVIGARTSVQEGAVLHVDPGVPMVVGANVTIGHLAMLHGCTIGDTSLIGIHAIIMNNAVIGAQCLVAAGALVSEGKAFADRLLIVGAPAKVKRELSVDEIAGLSRAADVYVAHGKAFKAGLERIG